MLNELAKTENSTTDYLELSEHTIDQLLEKAQQYGRISLWQCENKTFHFGIKFATIEGTGLNAESSYHESTIKSAIIAALIKAEKIREQFK